MLKELLPALFYFILFNLLIYRFKKLQFKNFKPFFTHLLFNLKFLVGIFIWFIYTFYYQNVENNDVHKFYKDAVILRDVADESPKAFLQLMSGINGNAPELEKYTSQMKNWERNFDEAPINENRTIIRLNALIMLVSFKAYFAHILFMCFISLIGWILLTNAILGFSRDYTSLLAIPVLLLPSVLFWTSGVMKEPLMVLGLGLFINGLIFLNWRLAAGLIITLFIKFFALACLLPAAIAFFLFEKQKM